MASLIKNQILKHLSKFAKNLTVDQISVEVLKGKGALQNIELNEVVLTEVLELPAWLRVQKATCNSISVKIPWTSLKTLPVKLYIDEIRVEMVMSSDFRPNRSNTDSPSTPYSSADYSGSTAYNFANRVVEGMSLYINTVEVFFTSEKFGGSFMLSRLCVESRTPTWKEAADLHQTRIRDARLQQVLIFKQVSWQLLRIEASNISAPAESEDGGRSPGGGFTINAPLRLITNQGRCRVSMKKSTIDNSVIAGRLQLILGDILWVATLPQVRSAINFYMCLMEMIQNAAELNKVQKAEKLLQQADLAHMAVKNATMGSKLTPPQQVRGGGEVAFHQYDVAETSYHFYGARIDLHICDEPSDESASAKGSSANDGALQLTLHKLSFDFYPYHLAAGDRSSWIYYKDRTCREWILSSLDSYYKLFSSKLDPRKRDQFRNEWPKLMAQCCVVRLDDIIVHCVTRTGDKGSPEKLLSCDREVLKLPDDMPVLHLEFSDYYYASERCQYLPVPPSNTHVQWNPIRVFLDYKTIRWISYMYLDICNSLGLKSSSFETVPHHDVHLQALMPRVIVPADCIDLSNTRKSLTDSRPNCLVVQAASVVLDNTLIGNNNPTNRDALKRYVSTLEDYPLFGMENNEFTIGTARITPLPMRTEAFRNYLTTLCELEQSQLPLPTNDGQSRIDSTSEINFKSIENAASDIWTATLSPLWVDFTGPNAVRYPRPMPFLTDVPITVWLIPNIYTSKSGPGNGSESAMVTVLAKPEGPLKLLLEQDQYLFLQQVAMDLSRLMQVLVADTKSFTENIALNSGAEENSMADLSLCVCCLGPSIDVSLLLPSANIGTEADSGGSDRLLSRSSSEISSSVNGANYSSTVPQDGTEPKSIHIRPSNNVLPGSFQETFLSDGFTPDIDVASIDIAMGSVVMDDAVSVNDVSDLDDDQFVQIDSPDVSPFDEIFQSDFPRRQSAAGQRGAKKTMEAVEAYEEEVERLSGHNKTAAMIDLTTRALQKKVSVVNFHLRQCQLAFAYAGDEARLILLTPTINADEHMDIPLEEAHKLLNSKAPFPADQSASSPIPVMPDIGTFPVEIRSGFRDVQDAGYLKVDARNLQLAIRNENVLHLSAFIQAELPRPNGEIDEEAMQLNIRVTDSTILLTYPNGLEPVKLLLDSVRIVRTKEKVLQVISSKDEGDKEKEKSIALERENADLRKKLAEAKAFIQRLAKENLNVAL